MPFWTKDKIEFDRGDSVKIKKGVKFPKLKIDISEWHGRVTEIDKKSVEVELDSISLRGFNVTLLNHFIEKVEYPHLLTLPKNDLEKSEPRDEYDDVELAQDELIAKIDATDRSDPKFLKESRKWTRHFIRSEIYKSMEKSLRIDIDSVIEFFTNQMYDYEDKIPKKWNVKSAKKVFLHWASTKISADKAFFETYGEILLKYFYFLENRKYLKTKSLQELSRWC